MGDLQIYKPKNKKTKKTRTYQGKKVKIDPRDKSGLSNREFTQIKRLLPKIETKMGEVTNIGFLIAPYQTGFQLANIPIIGEGVCGSVGPVQGVDWIQQGTKDGQRVGGKIFPKSVITDLQFCIDEQKSASDLLQCPYQIRWWVIRVKGTNDPPGQGGLASGLNATWQSFFDLGNENYVAPQGNNTDVYNKVNRTLYTVYKEGTFQLIPVNCKHPIGGGLSDNIPTPSINSKIYKHIRLDLTKYVAKALKYSDDPLQPSFYGCNNDSLYITFNITRYDNQPIPGGSMYVNTTVVTKMTYTDA